MRIRRQSVVRLASAVSLIAGLGVMLSASGPASSGQLGAAAPSLFEMAVAPARDASPGAAARSAASGRTDRAVVRSRPVTINMGVLRAADSPVLPVGRPATITLNLFGDVTLTAVLDRVDEASGGFTWVGHVAGVDMSTVTLASVGDVVAGSIATRDAFYTVQYVGNGLHEVRQVDQSKYLRELEPKAPVANRAARPERAAADAPVAARDDGSLIDVLVLYTAAAETAGGGTSAMLARINLGISETNTSYANSGVTPRLHLVGPAKVTYTESNDLTVDLEALATPSTALGTTAATLRDSYGADLTMLITSPVTPNACGIGYQMATVSSAFEPNGFSVVEQSCISPEYTFAHELGHNMGARHDWYVDSGIQPHTYAHGYVDPVNRFRTVMSYSDACDDQHITCARLLYWANPLKTSPSGYGAAPMGIAGGTKSTCPKKDFTNMACDADDHLTLNETALTVANFRQATTNAAPVVTTDPSAQTVAIGSTATFTAAAAGNPVPTVQWQVSADGGTTWTDIGGATSTTYTFTVSLGVHLNQYRAVFTNTAGTATTLAAVLKVQGAPLVTTSPSSQLVVSGASVTFSVAASGTPAPTLQWQESLDGGVTWTNISGATSGSYGVTAGSSDHLRQYRVVLTNSQGTATSAAATLTLQNGPVVIVQPVAATVMSGSSAAFAALADGTPAPTVQWQVSADSGSTWTSITGATGASYKFTAAAADSLKQYRAVFTNSVAAANSRAGVLTVRTATGPFIRSMQLPEGGRIRAIAVDPVQPQMVYAALWSTGVVRSVDGGRNWLPVLQHKGKFDVEALAIDPQDPGIVYAGTTAGVYKSVDRGTAWSLYATGLNVLSLAVDPGNSLVVYAGTNGTGVHKSTDGGVTWTPLGASAIDGFVPAVAVNPHDAKTIFAGTDNGLFVSTDAGASWTKWSGVVRAFAFDPRTAGVVYAVGDWVYKSTDGGANWTKFSEAPNGYDLSVAVDSVTAGTVYVGNYYGVRTSADGGASFGAVSMPREWGIRALAADPATAGTVYAGTNGGGLFKSADAGASWTASSTGLAGGISALVVDSRNARTLLMSSGTSLYCGVELWGAGGNGVYRSTDGGTTWSPSTAGLAATGVTALAADPNNPDVVYAGVNGGTGGVYKSTDAGLTWISVSSGSPIVTLLVDRAASGTVYAGSYGGGIFKTTDGGAHWAAINTGLTNHSVFALAADPATPTTVYAGTEGDGVFKSTNGGGSWTKTGTGARVVLGVVPDPGHTGVLFAAGWVDGIYRSADSGATWTPVSGAPSSVTGLAIDPASPATFYATSYDDGLFTSADGGVTWSAVESSVTPVAATTVSIPASAAGRLYVGSENAGVLAAGATSGNWHPADTNGDGRLSIDEVTAYGSAWRTGAVWPTGPNPIPIDYVTRAGFLWRNGETYQRAAGACPACWIPAQADRRDASASVWKVSFDAPAQAAGGGREIAARRR